MPTFHVNVVCRSLTFSSSAPELKTVGAATPGADAYNSVPDFAPAGKGRPAGAFCTRQKSTNGQSIDIPNLGGCVKLWSAVIRWPGCSPIREGSVTTTLAVYIAVISLLFIYLVANAPRRGRWWRSACHLYPGLSFLLA
jgi:hypothetical protein